MNPAATLPGGCRIALAAEVRPRLLAGVLVVEGVAIAADSRVWEETATVAAALRSEYAGRLPREIAGLHEARRLYKSFGMEPTRHRPSSEALLRRILRGKDLYRLNNAVDACNLGSLEFLLPIGMYDLAAVRGDVTLRIGTAGEEYAGIRKGDVHLAGRLGLFDEAGPFGSPTSDSARTCITERTTALLAVVMATADYAFATMERNLARLAALYTRYCGGEIALSTVLAGGLQP